MKTIVRRFLRDEEGASAIEYALIAGLIAVVIATTVGALGDEINAVFTTILEKLQGINGTGTE